MRTISISTSDIDAALDRVNRGLDQYLWLQAELHRRNVAADAEFQRKFAGFYRVRRNAQWRAAYFDLLERGKASPPSFGQALRTIHAATGRVEASFASKLVASIDPHQPVIDSIVVANLGLKLPKLYAPNRLEELEAIHQQMAAAYADYLSCEDGGRLIDAFEQRYPASNLTPVKILDLVLWKITK